MKFYSADKRYLPLNYLLMLLMWAAAALIFMRAESINPINGLFIGIYIVLGGAMLIVRPWAYVATFLFMLLNLVLVADSLHKMLEHYNQAIVEPIFYLFCLIVAALLRNRLYLPLPEPPTE